VTSGDEQTELAESVLRDLLDGKLQPLADYLRAGRPIPRRLAFAIADCIEGNDTPFHIYASGKYAGYDGLTKELERDFKTMTVGVYMQDRYLKRGRAGLPRAAEDTALKFNISERKAKKARDAVMKFMKGVAPNPAFDLWEYLKGVYLPAECFEQIDPG
jgi:hypothetical protein